MLLARINRNVVEWISESDMTEEEKHDNPSYKTTGGYLKKLDKRECAQIWWDSLTDGEKKCIYDIPNFDKDKFEKCVGVEI